MKQCREVGPRMDPPPVIDWPRLLDDLAFLGFTGDELAERVGLRVTLLQRVATGKTEPTACAGDRLAMLWCDLTGKPGQFLPRTADPAGTERPEVAGIDSNDVHAESLAQLEAIAVVWARIERPACR